MTATQKGIAVLGLFAIAITACFAPYEYTAHDEMGRLAGHGGPLYTGVTHAPLWKAPESQTATIAPHWFLEQGDRAGHNLDSVRLDAGRLGLWWGAIAAVTTVAMVLVAPRKSL